ncbi:MAG TPA: ATP-binding cassette domain-containing protein [Opitutaceae bacterium]|jgi:phospholipid/cholesterol/gamma-HCH transport system ATP-binding protein|nr:ATP-binding cassette domain-containing protein [Opitutaceae bacterium]
MSDQAEVSQGSFCSKTRNPFTGVEANAVGVKVDHVSKSYGGVEVLSDVSFDVKPGEIFVLMGPSGSGKSVLLRHIAGLELPSKGTITVDGQDPSLEETREKVRVALVFQAGALFNSLSVYDNLALYPREHRSGDEKAIEQKVMHALKILSVEDAAKKYPSELSGGMKKRVSIARALVMEPQLLLYDEPTSELDPVMSATISEIIATLKNEYSVTSLVVTHDRSLALTISNRVGILMDGKLITLGTPGDLQKSKDPRIVDFLNPKIDIQNPRFKKLETKDKS